MLSFRLNAVIGFRRAPFRSVGWLFGLFVTATVLAHFAWTTSTFAPASDVLNLSAVGWLVTAPGAAAVTGLVRRD